MYVLYACAKKKSQKSPEHTSEHAKFSRFPGGMPSDPPIYIMGSAFVFALVPPNPLGSPDHRGIFSHKRAPENIAVKLWYTLSSCQKILFGHRLT